MIEQSARSRLKRWCGLFGVVATLSACGDYGPDLRVELGKALPAGWQVEQFQIDEWKVINRAADHWSYNYTARIAATEDLYRELGTLSGQTIVVLSEHKNSYHVIEGSALAVLQTKEWDTEFGYGGVLTIGDGKALSAFPVEHMIVDTPHFEIFLNAAKQDLDLQQDRLLEEHRLYETRLQEWVERDREAKEIAKRTDKELEQEQQKLRRERLNILSFASDKRYEIGRALQQEHQQKLDAHRKELDSHNAALQETYRTRMSALRIRIDALRKSVSNLEFSQNSSILYDEERALGSEYRNARDQAFARYQSQLSDAQQELKQRRTQLGENIQAQVREDLESREAALKARLQQQQDDHHVAAQRQVQEQEEFQRILTDLRQREAMLSEQQALISALNTNSSTPASSINLQ